uniref:CD248 molecule, endosialin a n=1 Tax=Xiphophorus maculatus TaxID=8083 RepID=A0A3B5QQV9_XIPMA
HGCLSCLSLCCPATDWRPLEVSIKGCFVIYFEHKIFLDSWRSCKEKGGNLATIKRKEEAIAIATLFSTVDLRWSRTKVKVWIGLQRQPRQCNSNSLRGFSWTTGDQDTEYTNWQTEDSPDMCLVSLCVSFDYDTLQHSDNFKWFHGPCSIPADGYLCHFAYNGMCSPLSSEGSGVALYKTPFNLLSTTLTHLPVGSVANLQCLTNANQKVQCVKRTNDGSVGWSPELLFCSNPSISHKLCEQGNGGCEHFCTQVGGQISCDCAKGFHLRYDGQTCEPDVCQGVPCEFECLPLSDGYPSTTLGAGIRTLTSVHPLVSFETRKHRETFPTLRTRERTLGAAVHQPVVKVTAAVPTFITPFSFDLLFHRSSSSANTGAHSWTALTGPLPNADRITAAIFPSGSG